MITIKAFLLKKINLLTLLFIFHYSFSTLGQIKYEWAQSFGTKNSEYGNAMAIDSSDNIILAGTFVDSLDLDTSDSQGSGYLANNKHVSAFISKYDFGGKFVWAKQIKGDWGRTISGMDSIRLDITSISVDKEGNIYATGKFNGLVDFDPSETNTVYLTNPIPPFYRDSSVTYVCDIFVLKLNSNGDFQWVRQIGGESLELGGSTLSNDAGAIVVNNGNVYVVGKVIGDGSSFKDPDGTPHSVANLGDDGGNEYGKIPGMFILKMTDQGDFVWSKGIKYASIQCGDFSKSSIVVDADGNVLISGSSFYAQKNAIDFDPNDGEQLRGPYMYRSYFEPDNYLDIPSKYSFVLKLNSNGEYVWVAINKGSDENSVASLTTDKHSNVYYTGWFYYGHQSFLDGSSGYFDADPTSGTKLFYRDTTMGSIDTYQDVYITKLDKDMNFIFAKHIGGFGRILAHHLKVNSLEEIYLHGGIGIGDNINSTYIDFDPDPDATFLATRTQNSSDSRLYVLKLAKDGKFKWVRQFGLGLRAWSLTRIALNKSECNLFVGGTLGSGTVNYPVANSDWDPDSGVGLISSNGFVGIFQETDIFLARYYDYDFIVPKITALSALEFCPGDSVILQATDSLPNYTWSPSGETTQSITVQAKGKYYVTTHFKCIDKTSDTVEVKLFAAPKITQITPVSETIIKQGDQIQINVSVNNGNTYSWSPDSTLSCSDCLNPLASPVSSTNYCITVMSEDSCVATECVKINIEPVCKDIFIPNAFSPNEDGNNDVLELQTKVECITDFNLQIYDRWGEMVFEATKPTETWDGKYNGKELNNAVFVYQMKYKTIDSIEYKTKKGNVSIIK